MQQLSLFTFPDDPKPAIKETKQEGGGMQQSEGKEEVIVEKDDNSSSQTAINTLVIPQNNLVFSDEKIAVRIKLKPPASVQFPTPTIPPLPKSITKKPLPQKRGRKSLKDTTDINLLEIPDDTVLFEKQYYTIGTVALWLHVNTSLLRFWEKEFDELKPRKTRKGDRLFRPEDVKMLQTIYYLLRHRKFSIAGAKEYLKAHRGKVDINMQLAQTLTHFRDFLLEIKANLST